MVIIIGKLATRLLGHKQELVGKFSKWTIPDIMCMDQCYGSLVNQAVQSIDSPLSLFFFSIIFNILIIFKKGNVKNDGKEKIMLKVSLITKQLGLPG